MEESITNQPIVIDNGSGMCKAGFAGDDVPPVIFPSFVGRPKHVKIMAGALEGDRFVGSKAIEHRGAMRISYPMEHGIVNNWEDMEAIWEHIYSKECLDTASEEHPVLLTEAPLNPRQNRERGAEIFFEQFNVPALFISPQATLSLYASGATTGVVLDVGDGVAHAVPVYQGFAMPHAIMRTDIAGRDVTDHLQLLLRRAGHIFSTSAEQEVVKSIKEELCYVAVNPTQEEQIDGEDRRIPADYVLPDGRKIKIGSERFRAPEILFNPHLIGSEYSGVHMCLSDSIFKSDMDIRRSLYNEVVLSGGSTMFHGFGERLLNEMAKLAPSNIKIRIRAPPNRKISTWVGGSILASLNTFKTMWIRKHEFEEYGSSIVHRKTL